MKITPQPEKAIKIFYSYSHKDEALRKNLEKHLAILRRLGIISDWHDRNIMPGNNWEQEIDENLDAAHLILFLISSDFLASDYCYGREMQRALARQALGDAQVVPILVRSVSWEDAPFHHLQVLPRNGVPIKSSKWLEDEAWTQVVKELRKVISEIRITEHSTEAIIDKHQPARIFHLPYPRNPFFTGREDILLQLRTSFAPGKSMALTQSIGGLGGVGKTQIAIEYAYRYQQDYHYVFWINADTSESLQTDFIKVASLLRFPLPGEDVDIDITMNALREWAANNKQWLLLLDNADNLALLNPYQSLLQMSQGHILITTRATATGSLTPRTTSIEPMEKDESVLLLLRRAKVLTPEATLEQASAKMREEAGAIVNVLDGLPLALDQAGAYVEETGCGLSSYMALYEHRRRELLEERGRFAPGHPEPVATTWSLSFLLVERANPAAAELLRFCAFLQPDAIPIRMMLVGSTFLGPVLEPVASDLFELNRAIRELLKFSLLKRSADNADNEQLQLHRLMQAVLIDYMSIEMQKTWVERVIHVLLAACSEIDPASWEQCQPYVLQSQRLLLLTDEYRMVIPEVAQILALAAGWLNAYFYYAEAQPLFERALQICEQVSGPQHPATANSLNNLALLYRDQGNYAKAQPLYERALQVREQVSGPQHPATATSLNNLAGLYCDQGNYAKAQSLFERALQVREQVLGPQHPATANSLNNLAGLYRDQGNYAKAQPLYERALQVREQVLGPQHPATATSLNNLALLYRDQGSYAKAQPLFERALQVREQVLGPQHPHTATSLNNLALLYRDQGNYAEAQPLFERALQICEQVSGPQHPDTANSLSNLAGLNRDQGNYAKAQPLFERALQICEQVLGPQHPDTATSLNNLADLYRDQGNYAEAQPLYERALQIREQVLGPQHSATATSLNNLAGLYRDQGNYAKAQPLFERALQICEQVLGPNHSKTKVMKENYLLTEQKLSDMDQHIDS
ncbi:tetratricopeptide repeat protein [Ktedonobacteria bacterium brp13]|nr:tetratricopeptide repeat protein [Ktedonobacteria bacterium brp13]